MQKLKSEIKLVHQMASVPLDWEQEIWAPIIEIIEVVNWIALCQCTLGQHWLLKQFGLNHPIEHIQKPKLPKLYVRVETSTSYFIIHNQFVK